MQQHYSWERESPENTKAAAEEDAQLQYGQLAFGQQVEGEVDNEEDDNVAHFAQYVGRWWVWHNWWALQDLLKIQPNAQAETKQSPAKGVTAGLASAGSPGKSHLPLLTIPAIDISYCPSLSARHKNPHPNYNILLPGKLAYSPLSARSIHKLSTSPIISDHVSFKYFHLFSFLSFHLTLLFLRARAEDRRRKWISSWLTTMPDLWTSSQQQRLTSPSTKFHDPPNASSSVNYDLRR